MESWKMFFTSRRIRLNSANSQEGWLAPALVGFSFILLFTASALGQTPDAVLASVDRAEITLKQVDDSVATRIYPLQQQLYAVRKAALENLLTAKLLESEATARGISIEELRRQLTLGDINVTRAQVEEAYAQNASFFASMSPDEARERLRLDL